MTYKELQQQCPIIANSKHLFNTRQEAVLAQAEFFCKRSFILKLLSPRQAIVLDLRYGITNGKIMTCREVSDKLGISGARVLQIEQQTMKKIRKFKYLVPLVKYTDETFDDSLIENFHKVNYKNQLYKDIFKIITEDDLKIVKDLKIEDCGIKINRNQQDIENVKTRLNNQGIIYCSEFINVLKNAESVNQFITQIGISYSTYTALIESICDLIKKGYLEIKSEDNRLTYLQHKADNDDAIAQKHKEKVERKQQIKQERLIQEMINESKRQDRCRDALTNPEILLIEDLNLSARAYHKLKQQDINTLQDLLDNNGEFRFIKHIGEKAIKEILLKLKELGIEVDYDINIPINDFDINNPQSVRVEDLGFQPQVYNALKRNGINTLQDILNINYDMEGLKRFGPARKHKVEQRLLELGITQNK